jgi:serine/threonine protein kinase
VRPLATAPPPPPPPPTTPPAKFLRSGSYGCTYRPPLTCDGETTTEKNTVTKLIQDDDAQEELGFAKILEPIDPSQQYFIYPGRSCKRTLKIGQPDYSETSKCMPTTRLDEAMLLIMPDGGTNLEDFDPPQDKYGATFSGARNLLEGLKKLHDAEHVHFDIKPENLVGFIDGDVVKLRFIDFGLMKKHIDWQKDDYKFEFTYPWWIYEIRYLSDYYNDHDKIRQWKKYARDSLGYQSESRDSQAWANPVTGGIITPEIARESRELYVEYQADKPNVGSRILVMNDGHSLGRSLEQFYYRLTSHSPDGSDIVHTNAKHRRMIITQDLGADQLYLHEMSQEAYETQKKLAEFSKLWFHMCETMMHPRVTLRMSLADALKYFDETLAPAIPQYFS